MQLFNETLRIDSINASLVIVNNTAYLINSTLRGQIISVNDSAVLINNTLTGRINSINSSFLLENITLWNRINSLNSSLLSTNTSALSINTTKNIQNLINNTNANFSSIAVGGNVSASTGFFSKLGDLITRITKGWFTDLDSININSSVMNGTNIYQGGNPVLDTRSNTTENIGNLYNFTAGLIANKTFLQNFTTATIQSFINNTNIYLASLMTTKGSGINEVNLSGVLYVNSTSGNVGIGTASPIHKLQVTGGRIYAAGTGVSSGITFDTWEIFQNTTNDLMFRYNGFDRFYINNSGNVGIGTIVPTGRLEIYGVGQTTSALTDAGLRNNIISINANGNTAGDGGAITFGSTNSISNGSIGVAAIKYMLVSGSGTTRGDLAFSTRTGTGDTSLTENMRIQSGGNVGIGTTSPVSLLELKSPTSAGNSTSSNGNGTITAVGTEIGNIIFRTNDASDIGTFDVAKIGAVAEGVYTGVDSAPTGFDFFTTPAVSP